MQKVIPISTEPTKTSVVSTERLALTVGLIIAACLIGYFMIMKYANLLQIFELRVFDFLILGIGIFMAFRYYQTKTKKKMMYLQGLLFGLSLSAFSTIPFALFTGVYFEWLDPQLLVRLRDSTPILGVYISPFKIGITTIAGGMAWGMVISFLLMQFFKNDSAHMVKSDEPKLKM